MSRTIFSLRASNSRARKVVEHIDNSYFASIGEGALNIGTHTSKSPADFITIATLGSGSMADVYVGGSDIASIHCAFVVNYKTGVILLEVSGTCSYIRPIFLSGHRPSVSSLDLSLLTQI